MNDYDLGHWSKPFPECLGAVHAKLWKYVSKHMEFAKQARIFDPRQVPSPPTDPSMYPLMFPQKVHTQSVETGEWALYKASVVKDTRGLDIHQ